MMFISKKHLPRRTFLRGVGVTLALPLLDSMVPAQTPLGKTAAAPTDRFCGIYVPHGATMDKWTPAQEGAGFEFTETLKPLEKLRDRICVVSNLAHPSASGVGSDAGADHARSAAVFLSGAHPEKGSVHAGMTMDQVLAQHIGQDTPLPSIELGIEEVGLNCGSGYGCAYFNTISWRTPTLPLPMENSPQVVFERLFGDGANSAQRLSRKKQDSSILDSVTDKVARLQGKLDPSDRVRLSEYLDDIREIERRIQKATEQSANDLERSRSAGGNSRGVRGSHQADVRFIGAGLALRDHPHFDHDVRARHQRSHLSGQRRARRVPRRVAPLQRSRQHGPLCADQQISRADARLFPGKAARHARWRRQSAGPFDGPLRQQHEQRQSARSRSAAHPGGGRRFRQFERRTPPVVSRAHAHVEFDAGAAR